MKILPLLCSACLLAAGPLRAQDFTLDWFTVAAGGGESSGGDFELNATIGQPDAGNAAGGDFDLVGGFWSIITLLETPDAPSLNISMAAGELVISWLQNGSIDFTLEQTTVLANPPGSTSWTTVSPDASTSNGVKSVRLPVAAGHRFYRLHKP
jgi:hypothetical protein